MFSGLNYQILSAKISGTELAAASIRCAGPRPKAVEKAGSNKVRPQVRRLKQRLSAQGSAPPVMVVDHPFN